MASVKTADQLENSKNKQERNAMVAAKGKSNVGLSRVFEDTRIRKSGVRSFKVYSEKEQVKVGNSNIKASIEAPARRSVLIAKKGVALNSASDIKVGFKNSEKAKGKLCSSNVGRRALADVSNVKVSARNVGRNSSKQCEKTMFSAGSGTRMMDVLPRKPSTGRLQERIIQCDTECHTSKRASTSLKASSDYQRITNSHESRASLVTEGRYARKHVIRTRNSLPVPKGVRVDTSKPQENARISEMSQEKSGCLVRGTANKNVVCQLSRAKGHLWRNRVSDGFIGMGQTTVNAQASSRKSFKLHVKTTLAASNAQRTSKSKCKSSLHKSVSTAAMPSENKEEAVTSSLPENSVLLVSHDTNQGVVPSDGASNPSTKSSEIIARKKSTRRKSYTSLLIQRSKLLKECGEPLEQEKLPSIDNDCNQLEVSEYVDEIYQYYWVTEAHNPALGNYMSMQTEITSHMRGILVNWLIEVHYKFDLMPETLYLTVTLLDQYLSQVTINKNEIQLVGLTVLLLASKYEDFWHPRIKDLISISAESYTRDQMLGMEKLILKKLKFRLNSPTPYVFMMRFLKAAQSDTKLEHLAFYLIELCLVEYEALAFKPSLLCASALYVARCTLQMTPWTSMLRKHARYEATDIRDCGEMILRFQKAARTGQLRVTSEKYLRPDLSGVAAIKPLESLPV
ncbi:Cyclin [Quillaja saponaria]|uniref:B-like cyclin n=1 Tax=Quillaja saponaria TaxID=32244 RepID=A0AAD7KZX6_QUISA|nr:Cyclin [Quillaja saponaria]